MIFKNDKESMEWKILQYQYPDADLSSDKTGYSYAANWLKIQVSHQREGYGPAVFRESFLLTYELKELIDAMRRIYEGEEYYYKAEFVEPVLEVEINRHRDEFYVCFDLYFENYEMMVADNLSEEELKKLIDQLEALLEEYPER
ncbi:MAG: hypothetical protein PUB22_06825 [Clostridiales bacterium]|nr:hypothetical protein [Clostridiales bacterium]